MIDWLIDWLIGAKKFRPVAAPLLGGAAGRPKFNQLEMVTTLTQFGENRCTQFQVFLVTDSPTHTHAQTHKRRQDSLQYTAPQLGVQCN